MANLVITATTNTIAIDFGDYATALNMTKGSWRKDEIVNISLVNSGTVVQVVISSDGVFHFVHAALDSNLIVDTVAGQSPSSASDLYDKLIALIA